MAANSAFLGHGIFTEFSVTRALARYAHYNSPNAHPAPRDAIDRFVFALQDMGVRTVWIQLFSRDGDVEPDDRSRTLRKTLIDRLGQAQIKWAGWGYCAGKRWSTDKTLIVKFKNDLQMSAFVIDAEPGNLVYPNPDDPDGDKLPDLWRLEDFDAFTDFVSQNFGKDNLALTTWPVLQIQDDERNGNPLIKLMEIASPRISLFVPQAYWMSYPTDVHYGFGLKERDYPRNDSISFVRLVVKSWRMLGFNDPLVIAGQAYWGEKSPAQATMEGKVKNFSAHFPDWSQIAGFGWYHAGMANTAAEGSMSDAMITGIVAGRLGGKPYQQP